MLISIIVNVDTRPEKNAADLMFSGVCDSDFLDEGLLNKRNFFKGFDTELIVFVDQHLPIPEKTLNYIQSIADTVCIRKHTSEPLFNDHNYIAALQLARGDIVCHFDQDVAAFTRSPEPINNLIKLLDRYSYISYPSHWSPRAVSDASFDYDWASTRFFMCKRETLDFTEIDKCLHDNNYWTKTYPVSRVCGWTEHILGSLAKYNGKGVFYPPMDLYNYAIFSWSGYEKWTLRRLNEYNYDQVMNFIHSKGGVQYPCDIKC